MYRLFAAKTGEDRADLWLPLKTHLEDTAAVAERLVDRLSDAAIGAIGMERPDIRRILEFLAMAHDIGKGTVLFQNTITAFLPAVRERLEQAGLCVSDGRYLSCGDSPHALAGGCILIRLGCPECLAEVVAAHHGKPQEADESIADGQMCAYALNYYDERDPALWQACWREMLDAALQAGGFSSAEELPKSLTVQAQMLFSGLLVMADWIASNPRYFPLISVESTVPDLTEQARADAAWKRLALPDCWQSMCYGMDSGSFACRFGFPPNEVQRTVLDRLAAATDGGIVILEAQMGVGKTEAALGAAEILAAQHGCGGLYFGLPTQATANGIFPRLEKWAADQSREAVHAIRLAHGMVELNEEYLRLTEGAAATSEDENNGGLTVHRWFSGKKQALLAEFVIGTVDQLLMAALKQRHLMLRHLGLAGKVVIIDECHAYDAYMSRYLDRSLTWLGAYHVPVIILSATLPAERRKDMVCAYLNRKPQQSDQSWSVSRGYPLLTWTDGRDVLQETIPYTGRERTVFIRRSSDGGVPSYLGEMLQGGGCAGVIVNTVRRAQELAKLLSEQIPNAEVLVFHAGFLLPDRAEKEKKLLQRLGKSSTPEMRNHLIVVGTQVLEQSLDIDFDVMLTDLCPMDLLLQRMGRLHRHERARPKTLEKAVCTVLTPQDGTLEKGAKAIYDEWPLQRAKELLPETIVLPTDIPQLVQDAYQADASASFAAHQIGMKRRKKNASAFCVDPPRNGTFCNLLSADIGGSASAEAAVRDGDPSIEVLLLMERDGRVRFLPWQNGGAEVASDHVPSEEECRQIARQQIRLPHCFCTPWNVKSTIGELEARTQARFAEWQQSPLLRGELILLLNSECQTSLMGYQLTYSRGNGLEYEKEDEV